MDELKELEPENIMKCYECGKLSPHTEYRIKGFRSRCCNA